MALISRNKIYHAAIYNKLTKKTKWTSLKTSDWEKASILYAELLKRRQIAPSSWEDFCKRYIAYCKGENHTPETIERDLLVIKNFNNFAQIYSVQAFNADVIERYKIYLVSEGRKPNTVNREISVLKAMARKAMQWKLIEMFDLRIIPRLKEEKKITTYFEDEHIKEIRASMKKPIIRPAKGQHAKFEAILLDVALYTGFRRREMMQLRWEDIDFDKNLISVRLGEGRTIKNKKERVIQLHAKLKVSLLNWQKVCGSPLVFQGVNKWKMSMRFKRMLERAGVEGHLHLTRHTVGTNLVRELGSDQAKDFLGHASVTTTERYSHQKSELVPVAALKY